jgi:hypothetical protein
MKSRLAIERCSTVSHAAHRAVFDPRELDRLRAANDALWRESYWNEHCDDHRHFEICMRLKSWFPREDIPYIADDDEPRFRLLYASHFWKHLLDDLKLPPLRGSVLELLPGRTMTIAIALESLGFRGTFDRLDLSECIPDVSSYSFTGQVIRADLFDCTEALARYDVIIGNHIIDDLLMHLHAGCAARNRRSTDGRALSHSLWDEISGSPDFDANIELVGALLDRLISRMRPGCTMIQRHYPSTFELKTSAVDRIDLLQGVFKQFCARLLENREAVFTALHPLRHLPVPEGEMYPESVLVIRT